jgi:hypoxia-inducible factor 1-alpha inhibitor (HIF hydroxylase)
MRPVDWTVSTPSSPRQNLGSALNAILSATHPTEELIEWLCECLERAPALQGSRHRQHTLIHRSPREILKLRRRHSTGVEGRGHSESAPPCIASDQSGVLPAEARHLLGEHAPFVLRNHGLWPAAEDHWGRREFLESELHGVRSGLHVLAAPTARNDFLYWMAPQRFKTLEAAVARGSDRVLGPYEFDEPEVEQLNLDIAELFALDDGGLDDRGRGKTFYLQHAVAKPKAAVDPTEVQQQTRTRPPRMQPTAGLGERMRDDITNGVNMPLLEACRTAGGFGPWMNTTLFLGGARARNARTRLHFDQVDNIYLQVAGTKVFQIYEPGQGGCLAPYPWHHPLDRSAQVDLRDIAGSTRRFPRFAEARGFEVVLQPGDLFFLPAYWWHEVLTAPGSGADASSNSTSAALTVSVNFWFATHERLARPASLPLGTMHEVELSRELEMLVADALGDRPALVPTFLRAMTRQLESTLRRQDGQWPSSIDGKGASGGSWPLLQRERPRATATIVDAAVWGTLFEIATAKLCLWLHSPTGVLRFLRHYCSHCRFERLALATQ